MSGFRMKGSARRTTMLSTFGVVVGGKHDGWRYSFLKFTCGARGVLRIELRVTPQVPAWPFPTEVSLTKLDFRHLEGVPGERAPKVDTTPLIEEAVRAGAAASQQAPASIPAGRKERAPKAVKLSVPQEELLADMNAGCVLKVSRETQRMLLVHQNGMTSTVPRSVVAALVKANRVRATGDVDEHRNQLYALIKAPVQETS